MHRLEQTSEESAYVERQIKAVYHMSFRHVISPCNIRHFNFYMLIWSNLKVLYLIRIFVDYENS